MAPDGHLISIISTIPIGFLLHPLDQEYPLPDAQLKDSADDVQTFGGTEEHRLAVRMPVLSFIRHQVGSSNCEVIMTVVDVPRGEPLQGVLHVIEKQRLIFVDDDSGCRVAGLNVRDAGSYSGSFDQLRDSISQINELKTFRGFQMNGGVMNLYCRVAFPG